MAPSCREGSPASRLKRHHKDKVCLQPRSPYCIKVELMGLDPLHVRLNSHYEAWSYKEKKHTKFKANRKFVSKEHAVKRCLLTLDLKPFRSQIKGKHSIMQSIRITSRHPLRIRECNQLTEFR